MSLPLHVEIEGSRQGLIRGSCAMVGREGTIQAHGIRHGLKIPSDRAEAVSNMGGVSRMHEPVTIVKPLDQSTPGLLQAMVSSERIVRVTIRWYRFNRYGHEEHYFTDILENALIKKHRTEMETEYVSISYEKITWRHETASIETEDRWQMMTTAAGIPIFEGQWRRRETSSLILKLVDDRTSIPVSGVKIRVLHGDGTFRESLSDSNGILKFPHLKKGLCDAYSDISLYWGACIGNTLAYTGTGTFVIEAHEPGGTSSLSLKPKYLAKIIEHRVQEGETLRTIAESHRMSFEDLAFFNWGTYENDEILRCARRDTGCARLTDGGGDLRFSDGTSPGIVFIPLPVKVSDLATDSIHTIRASRKGYDRFYETFELLVVDDVNTPQKEIRCELTNPDGTKEIRQTSEAGEIFLQGINAGKTRVQLVDCDSHDISEGEEADDGP